MPGQSTTSHSKPASQSRQGQSRPAQSKPAKRSAPQSGKPASSQQKSSTSQAKAPAQNLGVTAGGQPRVNKVVVGQPQAAGQYGDKAKKNKQQRTKESTKRQAMLNTHRINPFKYDMNQILETSAMDPAKASSFLASVIAKASRVSTRDAKDFVKTYLDAGDLTKDEVDKIGKLLDKYSRYR